MRIRGKWRGEGRGGLKENWVDISLIYFMDIKRFFFKFGTFQFAFCSILDEKFGGKTWIIWADQRVLYSLHTHSRFQTFLYPI